MAKEEARKAKAGNVGRNKAGKRKGPLALWLDAEFVPILEVQVWDMDRTKNKYGLALGEFDKGELLGSIILDGPLALRPQKFKYGPESKHTYLLGPPLVDDVLDEPDDGKVKVKLTILSARGLAKADFSMMGGGKSDPFVEVSHLVNGWTRAVHL